MAKQPKLLKFYNGFPGYARKNGSESFVVKTFKEIVFAEYADEKAQEQIQAAVPVWRFHIARRMPAAQNIPTGFAPDRRKGA